MRLALDAGNSREAMELAAEVNWAAGNPQSAPFAGLIRELDTEFRSQVTQAFGIESQEVLDDLISAANRLDISGYDDAEVFLAYTLGPRGALEPPPRDPQLTGTMGDLLGGTVDEPTTVDSSGDHVSAASFLSEEDRRRNYGYVPPEEEAVFGELAAGEPVRHTGEEPSQLVEQAWRQSLDETLAEDELAEGRHTGEGPSHLMDQVWQEQLDQAASEEQAAGGQAAGQASSLGFLTGPGAADPGSLVLAGYNPSQAGDRLVYGIEKGNEESEQPETPESSVDPSAPWSGIVTPYAGGQEF
jgi:hypothetical protein